jgi:hypothetical protein
LRRANPNQIGRALADRLSRRHLFRAPTSEPTSPEPTANERERPDSDAARLRRLFGSARVTPQQLRRGLLF